jgi:hypothetical protein
MVPRRAGGGIQASATRHRIAVSAGTAPPSAGTSVLPHALVSGATGAARIVPGRCGIPRLVPFGSRCGDGL